MFTIPIYKPYLAGNEKKYVDECLDSTWISSLGKFVAEFENKFAEYTGARYATTVCNGTLSLHLALLSLGVGEGDEVIVPTLTYIASVNAIAYTGATPIFVDSLETTWQMDHKDVRRRITSKTRAILAVHLYGHPCNMEELYAIAKENNIFLIEDCAESLGSLYNGKHVGSFGDVACYSFFGNKTITTGEGGMLTTNDETLYDRARHFKGQGLAKHRQYWHDVIGYNYRMTNICAAIGLGQLEQIEVILGRKQALAEWYSQGLLNLPVTFHGAESNVRHSYWMCSILVYEPSQRDPLRVALEKAGIETRPLFYPVHTMPMYSQKFQKHPVAESLGWRGINLPSWPGLEKNQVEFIVATIEKFFSI